MIDDDMLIDIITKNTQKEKIYFIIMINKIYRIITILEKEGLYVAIIETINYIFRRLFKIELLIKTPLDNLKYYLSKKLFTISHGKVMDGAYQNVSFNKQTHWSFTDFASKLLGSYELEVQKKICEVQKKYNLKNIINIGAGEGYHTISLVKNNYFEKGYAFEINKKGQKIIYDNLISNKIENKVKIFGEGNYHSIKTNIDSAEINSSLFLVDIEGLRLDHEIMRSRDHEIRGGLR